MTTTSQQPLSATTYDVRVWSIRTYTGKTRTSHTVGWRVGPRRHQRTFATLALADSFRADLVSQTRHGTPFNRSTGLPATAGDPAEGRTWYAHALAYVDATWPHVSPRQRKSTAEALTTLSLALATATNVAPPVPEVRRALFGWAFNATAHRRRPDPVDVAALAWMEEASVPLSCLREATWLHVALTAIATTQSGRPAAATTVRRKRATLHHALAYAVELDLFTANPLDRIGRRPASPTTALDPRVVLNPAQARALLRAVAEVEPALEGFFACLYYAGLRPAEARNLQRRHCTLPGTGWGELLLTGSRQHADAAWTDTGAADEQRPLKHRPAGQTRLVPAHPDLVAVLRRHLHEFGPGTDGPLFVTRTARGGQPLAPPYYHPVSMGTIYRIWHQARSAALSDNADGSQLARRPYDLRHACLSTWHAAGVPPAQVAAWAGNGTAVLLAVYAHCIHGQDQTHLQRIETVIPPTDQR